MGRALKRKRLLLILIAAGLAVVLLAAGVLGAWLVHSIPELRKHLPLEARLEVLRQQGLPTNVEELEAWYPQVPDSENAALLLLKAFDSLRNTLKPGDIKNENVYLDLPPAGEVLPPEMADALRELVVENQECLDYVRLAVEKPRCRYPYNFEIGEPYPDYWPETRTLSRLLGYQALLYTLDQDTEAAGAALRTQVQLCRTVVNEPAWYQLSTESVLVETLEQVLTLMQLKDKQLEEVQHLLEGRDPQAYAFRSVAAQQCFDLITLGNLFRPQPLSAVFKSDNPFNVPIVGGTLKELTVSAFLDLMGEVVALSRQQRSLRDKPMRSLQHRLEHGSGEVLRDLTGLAPIMANTGLAVLMSADLHNTRIALMITALAVERYREVHGRLPENLEDLAPEFLEKVPQDPYDGRSIKYCLNETGYEVYSVFENGRDDGGTSYTVPKARFAEGDLILTVSR